MKVTLIIGAHRCATQSFLGYVGSNRAALDRLGVAVWGPEALRGGLIHGLTPHRGPVFRRDPVRRATGRIRLRMRAEAERGVRHLLVCDPELLGGLRDTLAAGALYPGAGQRLARLWQGFGDCVGEVAVTIRGQDRYWPSLLAVMVGRGHALPASARRDAMARSNRSWRDVIADVACAMPRAQVRVYPFETFAGRPELLLSALTGFSAPKRAARERLNPAPNLDELRAVVTADVAAALPPGTGRWAPFDAFQLAALREAYADDLMWLAGGADGLALLADDPNKTRPGANPGVDGMTRGRRNDDEESRMAKARRG